MPVSRNRKWPKSPFPARLAKVILASFLLAMAGWPELLQASPYTYGTGFSVAAGPNGSVIATALHVIKGKGKVEIATEGSLAWQDTTVLVVDEESDLALLTLAETDIPALSLKDWSQVIVGSEIFVIGYPIPEILGLTPKISEGLINGLAPGIDSKVLFQLSASIHPGNSGSPVLTRDGAVVGLVHAVAESEGFRKRTRYTPQNISFAVNGQSISNFLERSGVPISQTKPAPSSKLDSPVIYETARRSIVAIRSSQ